VVSVEEGDLEGEVLLGGTPMMPERWSRRSQRGLHGAVVGGLPTL